MSLAAVGLVLGPFFAQALEDALRDVDFEILEIPLNSNRLWELSKWEVVPRGCFAITQGRLIFKLASFGSFLSGFGSLTDVYSRWL